MNTQVYDEATDWLVRHREGHPSISDRQDFDTWLRQSPLHLRAYLEISATWEAMDSLRDERTEKQLIEQAALQDDVLKFPASPALQSPAAKADAGLSSSNGHHRRGTILIFGRSWHRPFSRVTRVAFVCSVLVAIGGLVISQWANRGTYSTALAEQRSIVLSDGTTLTLNSLTRVRLRFTDERRDVELIRGQALFQVAHNAVRPFIVHSGAASIRAVGTQFDVYRKPADTVVTVVEGRVAVSQSLSPPLPSGGFSEPIRERVSVPEPILLAAGQQLTMSQSGGSGENAPAPKQADVLAVIAWKNHALVFESTPLHEVVEEFNRYNARKIVISDPTLAAFQISGVFSSADPRLLIKFLTAQPELSVEENRSEFRIIKK